MDPWKISTIALGTLSAVLTVALAAVWMSSPTPADDAPELAVLEVPTERTQRADEPTSSSIERIPLRPVPKIGSGGSMATAPGDAAPAWVTNADAPLPDDVLDRAREQMESEFRERRLDRRAEIRDEVDSFLDDEGIDAPTIEKVNDILDSYSGKMRDLRQQMRSGELDRADARGEFQAQRDGMQSALDEALGPDVASRLQERIPTRGGRGGPGGGRGPGVGGRGL